MKNKKAVLIVIIVCLAIFLPLTIMGAIFKNKGPKVEENPNHEFFYKGHLYFYDTNNQFLSKFECMTEICEYTTPIIDDIIYDNNYYKDGTNKEIGIIDNTYTFITDGDIKYLYNVTNGVKLQGYKAVKNYNTYLENSSYIIENNNNKWGVLTIGSVLGTVLPFEYDFIGIIKENIENGYLSTNEFVVSKDNKWQIISNEKEIISSAVSYPIINYTDKYIFTKSEGKYHIFDYNGKEYISNFEIKYYYLVDNYIGVSNGNVLYIYNDLNNKFLGNANVTNANSNITLKIEGNYLNVLNGEEIISTINIK